MSLEYIAFVGTILVAAAYIPQIFHLLIKHCAYGMSLRAWSIWLIASLLILPHALQSQNKVFASLQIINLTAISFILVFTYFHNGKVCQKHKFL